MNSITMATSGLQAAGARLDNAANNIANLNTPGFHAQEPVQTNGPTGIQVTFSPTNALANPQASNVDATVQMVELVTDKHSVEFDTEVIRTQDAMTQALLDMKV